MKLMPHREDYYLWYCDWCDSRNLTHWTRIEADKIRCPVCHQEFEVCSGVDEPEDMRLAC